MQNSEQQMKYQKLISGLKGLGRIVIAFSGGVDSSFLAHTARFALGKDNALAVTAMSETFPKSELDDALSFIKKFDIQHATIATSELATINGKGNPRDRCYYCKHQLFEELSLLAKTRGYMHVTEGSNTDDDTDFRPGRRALSELSIVSPLRDAGLSKQEIRDISRDLGLPTWDKPAFACLTSRFPYGVVIEERALAMIEKAETYLRSQGFRQCRVRCFGEKAVVEVEKQFVDRALSMKRAIERQLREAGFVEVEIDPLGYRMGRMNHEMSV